MNKEELEELITKAIQLGFNQSKYFNSLDKKDELVEWFMNNVVEERTLEELKSKQR